MKTLTQKNLRRLSNYSLKKNHEFKEIYDLNEADQMAGYYVMVLDEYKQVYIGTAKNIKRRIMSHWSKRKQFDRLIFGHIETSKLSIDSFRAFDTTRIFVYYTTETYLKEDNYINDIPEQFLCNRTGGGIPEFGVTSILASAKQRKLL